MVASRIAALVLTTLMVLAAAGPASVLAQDASPSPSPSASLTPQASLTPEASLTPHEAACASADDLTLIVDFLRETDASEDGWLLWVVGAIAGVSEVRQLAGHMGEVYQPLVEDLIVSLRGLRTEAGDARAEESLGAKLVLFGESITEVGTAMDALGDQLRTRCEDEAAA